RLDHWPGEVDFVAYLARTGIHVNCPGGNCQPWRPRQPRQSPQQQLPIPGVPDFDIFGGRDRDEVPPYVEPPQRDVTDERLERMESLIGRLVECETQPPPTPAPPAEPRPAEPPGPSPIEI